MVLDPRQAAAIDTAAAGIGALGAAGVVPFDHVDAITELRELEVLGRQVRARQLELMAQVDQRGLHRFDGHASAKVMVRHVARLSPSEAARRAREVAALRDLPLVRAAFAAGRIGVDHLERIGRAHANRRVREALRRLDGELADRASKLSYAAFDHELTAWIRLVDEDGTCDAAERTHANRDFAHLQDGDGGWHTRAHGGSLAGAEIRTVFDHFYDAETEADWAAARAEHGDAATAEQLPRTDAQRRYDAYLAMARTAAGAGGPGNSTVTTDIVIGHELFERHLRRFAGQEVEPLDVALVPADPHAWRSETLDGHPVDPTEAVAHALLGHVRRVVGADSVVVDLGRRSRLFRDAAALAVRLTDRHCAWPGCLTPVTHCQIDHTVPWNHPDTPGRTSPDNGGPLCGKHNRHKEHGFTVRRDPDGTWHTLRPDGTEIG